MLSRLLTCGVFAVLLLGLVSGCGKSKLIKVSGVLTWEDGTPVDGATIVFMPKDSAKKQASGFTGKDGTFALTTFNSDDGAMEGEYKVVVTKSDTADTGPGGMGANDHPDPEKMMKEAWQKHGGKKPTKSPIPEVYTKDNTTPLIATVSSSTGKIELKLKKV